MEAVHDGLGRLDGVSSISIDLQKNLVTIAPAKDRTLDLAAIPRAIRRAGFRPGLMTVQGTVSFESSPEGPRLRFQGWPFAFPWSGSAPEGAPLALLTAAVDATATPPVLRPNI
jgi:hypothetical protein